METRNSHPKATAAQAERLDLIAAEMETLKERTDDISLKKREELSQEYYSLIFEYDWLDEVFEENGKKGMKNVKGEVVVPAIYDGFCFPEPYFLKNNPVGARRGDYVALVARDGKGTPKTDFEYHYVERIPFSAVYAVWKEDDLKHFALMVAEKVITPYEIEEYYDPCNGAMLLEADGKVGALFLDLGLIYIKPEYDEIYDEGVGSDFIFVKDGKQGHVTFDKQFVSDEDFEQMSEEEQDAVSEIGFLYAPD